MVTEVVSCQVHTKRNLCVCNIHVAFIQSNTVRWHTESVSWSVEHFIMPHPQTWHLSQDASKASGECFVCHAVRQLHLKDGTVHLHGSRNSRCPGSGKPPAVSYPPAQRSTTSMASLSDSVASQSQSTVTQTHQAAQPLQSKLVHPSLSGNIIKHIPRSARPHCAAQLATTIK